MKLSQAVITKRNLSHISLFIHGVWQLRCIFFYLIWGFLVWFLGKHRDNVAKFRSLIFAVSAAFFTGSFLSMFIRAFFC